jgi:hypothetical protein
VLLLLEKEQKKCCCCLLLFFPFILFAAISIFCLTFLINTITMNTPCGLTQEKLEARDWKWVGENGECIAPFKNANGEIQIGCGELYASHPSSAQGKERYFPSHSFQSRLL